MTPATPRLESPRQTYYGLRVEVREYQDANAESPFAAWFDRLDAQATHRVDMALQRLALGNLSNVKSVGFGVLELRIDYGPGYRLYFGRDGLAVVVLLAGGTKKRQQKDIEVAIDRWQAYKARKKAR